MPKTPRQRQMLDFEIRFCEELIRKHPDFTDALALLAEAYTRRGDYDKGLSLDQHLTRLRADDPVVWYNLACSYALLKRTDDAFDALQQAITRGYDDLDHLQSDEDLSSLHSLPRFKELVTLLLRQRAAAPRRS